MSAITIPDMVAIVKKHGLVPVPFDINPDTMAPYSIDDIKESITEKVKINESI